ncbi:ATP-binding protein [Mesosutterella sp. AGMB02718]|uniref:ATP-binding protein n=1 Tax=Mesosutterella faecium TaxID=2925194 RepID=A0ABT7ING9_9BURK|nr:ATP-binding protein [Mesosutterella sp. AGMB02718]MDL2059924.1 ATP-binding protein [Mesosutterella sp. AGMB02718]
MPEVARGTPSKAVAVFGPRRVGKTTLLEELVGTANARWYIGDTPEAARSLRFQTAGDVRNALLQAPTLVIDEAHKIPDIGNIVKMLVDANERLEKPDRIFLTSSSPLYLASIKESALGRVVSRRMWPLSLKEIAEHASWGYVNGRLDQFLVSGMMPNVFTDPEGGRAFLEDYCDGLLLRDLLEQTPVRRLDKFRMLVQLLAYSVGSEVSYDGLARECGLTRPTVEAYIGKLEQSSIVRVCPSFSKNLASELKKGKKIYFFDNGIRNALIHNFAPLAEREDAGALWENFFFMERVKMHDIQRDFTQIYFWRNTGHNPAEVDLVEVRDQKIHAFECKLSDKTQHSRGVAKFQELYPDSAVEIVLPGDCQRIFS